MTLRKSLRIIWESHTRSKPAAKATRVFSQVGTPANGVKVVSTHVDDTTIKATFDSTTGNLS